MRVRYQSDADLNQKILAAALRLEPTIDFRTSHAANLAGISDLEVLSLAASSGRVLVSHDKACMPDAFAEFILTERARSVYRAERIQVVQGRRRPSADMVCVGTDRNGLTA
jgi:hypothetical protein